MWEIHLQLQGTQTRTVEALVSAHAHPYEPRTMWGVTVSILDEKVQAKKDMMFWFAKPEDALNFQNMLFRAENVT